MSNMWCSAMVAYHVGFVELQQRDLTASVDKRFGIGFYFATNLCEYC